ncbi:hypothetical protein VTK26DRAFT_8838 [Humicola hyalothermophila]
MLSSAAFAPMDWTRTIATQALQGDRDVAPSPSPSTRRVSPLSGAGRRGLCKPTVYEWRHTQCQVEQRAQLFGPARKGREAQVRESIAIPEEASWASRAE